ncbi:hypothetical protein JS530_10120 [Bifidobacterium sp. LC6]|uniref:Uncharacterized protein n=1 Tax=Bifidobacterium colobi TaxID=2809026 RepID=A0ABS5UZE3_9BIFI|nr:hypothetical protein [Bifidobacterium colobi]MBT1175846.1 hypothetical protein [Bifidobacterium colobi]
MKNRKLIMIVVTVVLALVVSLGYALYSSLNAKTAFAQDGYILGQVNVEDSGSTGSSNTTTASSTSANEGNAGYYFSAGDTYQVKYPQKIVFTDSSGERVVTDTTNFVHYQDESLSAFSKGVFLDLDKLNAKPLNYYNIPANVTMTKQGNSYQLQTVDGQKRLTNFIWKIEDNKYLVASNTLKLHLSKSNTKQVQGYVEVNFVDNNVVLLKHQTGTYQTIASDAYVELANGVKINLKDKSILQNDDRKLTLSQMIINKNDNIDVLPEDQQKTDENKNDNKDENKSESNDQNQNGQNNASGTNGTTTVNGGVSNGNGGGNGSDSSSSSSSNGSNNNGSNSGDNNTNNGNNSGNNGGNNSGTDEPSEPSTDVTFPTFEVTDFASDVNSVSANIRVSDPDDVLDSATTVKVVNTSTQKIVYSNSFDQGVYELDFATQTLEPETSYTLIANASYKYKEQTYNRDFVSKVFTTDGLGLTFEKNYVTDGKISIKTLLNQDSKLTTADLVINKQNATDDTNAQTKSIDLQASMADGGSTVDFDGLDSNTTYTVKLTNVTYDSSPMTADDEQNITTLKQSPQIGEAKAEANAQNGSFRLYLDKGSLTSAVVDPDHGITKYRYEIYNADQVDANTGEITGDPVKTVDAPDATGVNVTVDDQTLQRSVAYVFRLAMDFEDNEKTVEITSGISNTVSLDTKEYPSVVFTPTSCDANSPAGCEAGIQADKIEGSIKIIDKAGTIKENQPLTVSISGNDGSTPITQTLTYTNSEATLPFRITGLQANTVYTVTISGQVKLSDDANYVTRIIGSFTEKTLTTKNMTVDVTALNKDFKSAFDLQFQLGKAIDTSNPNNQDASVTNNTHEAQILNDVRVNIYPADRTNGTPLATMSLTNQNAVTDDERQNFDYATGSTMKADYYDKSIIITPKSFGLNNADFTAESYYTMVVEPGTDYTSHQNEIQMVNPDDLTNSKAEFKVYPHGFVPDAPRDTNNAITVTPIRNGDLPSNQQNGDLNSGTIVRYDVDANASYPSTGMRYAKQVIYNVYKVTGGYDGSSDDYSAYPNITAEKVTSKTMDVSDGSSQLPTASFNVGANQTLKRGYVYFFTYTVKLDLRNSDDAASIPATYPTDASNANADTVLRSLIVKCPKQNPTFRSYLKNTTEQGGKYTLEYQYKYKDVDNAYSDAEFKSSNGTASGFDGSLDANTIGSFTVTGASAGDVAVTKYVAPYVQPYGFGAYNATLTQHQITADISSQVKQLPYTVDTDSSRLYVRLTNLTADQDKVREQIAGMKITITDTETGKKQVFDDVPVTNTGAAISLMSIKEMRGHKLSVNAEAYFDGALAGTDQAANGNLVMVQYYNRASGVLYADGTAVASGSLHTISALPDADAMFSGVQEFSGKQLNNTDSEPEGTFKGKDVSYKFAVDTQGMNVSTSGSNPANDSYYVIRDAASASIKNETTGDIKFDYIYPTVSGVTVTPGVTDGKLTLNYDGVDASAIQGNKLYMQFTDANGNPINGGETYEIALNGDKYQGAIEYDQIGSAAGHAALEPGKDYYFRLYVQFADDPAGQVREVLDADNGNTAQTYHFTTAAQVTFGNTKYVYDSANYGSKSMNFQFDADIVSGYTVGYTLTAQDGTVIDLGSKATMKTIIEKGNNLRLPVGLKDNDAIPGRGKLVYGQNYTLTATATTAAGANVGSFSVPFLLEKLDEPYVSQFSVAKNTSLDFSVTVSDPDFSMVDESYSIALYEGTDVTDASKRVGNVINGKLSATDASGKLQDSAIVNFTRSSLKPDTTYTLAFTSNVNSTYASADSATAFTKTFTARTLNDYGVGFGDIYGSVVSDGNAKKIRLDLYSLVGSDQIKSVDYTIFRAGSGSVATAMNEPVTFTDGGTVSGEKVQQLMLGTDVSKFDPGKYEVKVVFKNGSGQIVGTQTVSFQYSTGLASSILSLFNR